MCSLPQANWRTASLCVLLLLNVFSYYRMCSLPQANWRTVSLCERIDRWKTRHKLRGKSRWFSAGHALMAKSSALSRSLWGVVILLWGVVISLDTQGGSKNLCFVQVSLRCGNLAFGCSNVGCSNVVRHTGLSILTEQYLLIHWYLRNNDTDTYGTML